jgi:hypothetical protein
MAAAKKHRVRILRNTKIAGELRRPGDIVSVDAIDFNTLIHFAKGEAVVDVPPVGGTPVADERETELKARISKRGRAPKPSRAEITADEEK